MSARSDARRAEAEAFRRLPAEERAEISRHRGMLRAITRAWAGRGDKARLTAQEDRRHRAALAMIRAAAAQAEADKFNTNTNTEQEYQS